MYLKIPIHILYKMDSSTDDEQIQSIDKMIKKGRKNIDLPMDA